MDSFDKYFVFKPCKSEGTLKASCRSNVLIDFEKTAKALQREGFEVLNVEPYLLVSLNGVHFSVFPRGAIVAKNSFDRQAFEEFAARVYELNSVKKEGAASG
ncbi:MAG TPA: hypothetical protein VJI67_02895 [archaeon]|nr:hypothetical protein [archaeon]HLD80704.1 hypothetical protein [archaeon]